MAKDDWHRDEFILVLDLYQRKGFNGAKAADLQEVSALLRSLPFNLVGRKADYRSPNSVHLRLGNFAHHDEKYPGKGMSGGGAECGRIWKELGGERAKVQRMAEAIRASMAIPSTDLPLSDEEEGAPEGRLIARMHLHRERDRRLVEKKKARALKETGKLACEACGFDYSKVYGERGAGYMECHHRTPLSELQPGAKTKLKDLALICANCHRIIHRKPWLSVEDLTKVLASS